jgi:spermidine synthase
MTLTFRQLRGGLALPVISALFFVSGLTALIYQVLWLRLLGLAFGVTTYAAGTVLASFFAGLALGSFVGGRLADRPRRPLLWYGVAEVLVGVCALASPEALDGVESLYAELAPALPSGLVPLTGARFLLAFVVLMVPTTMMGATFPLIMKSVARGGRLGARAGVLYGTNTAGGIAGTLLAGFVLIGGIGIGASFLLAASLNVVVGIAAILASHAFESRREEAAPEDRAWQVAEEAGPDRFEVPPGTRRLVLVVFGLSGLASLALEVVWFRMLVLYLDVTTYAFSVMLATVLLGIAAGGYAVSPLLERRVDWVRVLALLELCIGVLSMLSLALLANAYELLGPSESLIRGETLAMPAWLMFLTSGLTMLPAALLLGAAFPIGLRLWVEDREASGTAEEAGRFYSVNVIGGILGSLLAAFVLIPQLGSRASLIAAAAVSLACGLLLLAACGRRRRGFALAAGAAGMGSFVAIAVAAPDPLSAVVPERQPGERVLLRDEGVQTTVSVQRRPDGLKVLYLDGLHQSNDSPPQLAIHRRIGLLPIALHPDPRNALVVGLGGGATAGASSLFPGVRVDVVELSRGVVRAAELFRDVNHNVLQRSNVRLHVDDGRNFMLLADRRYDVITADLILPVHAGAGNLYSADYFRIARDRLDEDGLMLQWIGARDREQYELIMRTFLDVFPHATLWSGGSLMVGSKRPLRVRRADFDRKLSDPETRAALEVIGLTSLDSVRAEYVAGPREMRAFVGPGPILTDDQPRVEYFRSIDESSPLDLSRLLNRAR